MREHLAYGESGGRVTGLFGQCPVDHSESTIQPVASVDQIALKGLGQTD